jgi:hypothetical protein
MEAYRKIKDKLDARCIELQKQIAEAKTAEEIALARQAVDDFAKDERNEMDGTEQGT